MGAFFSVFFGCMDETAFNYNPLANFDDGTCVEVAMGCIYEWADNYDESANTDDGTCLLEAVLRVEKTAMKMQTLKLVIVTLMAVIHIGQITTILM